MDVQASFALAVTHSAQLEQTGVHIVTNVEFLETNSLMMSVPWNMSVPSAQMGATHVSPDPTQQENSPVVGSNRAHLSGQVCQDATD